MLVPTIASYSIERAHREHADVREAAHPSPAEDEDGARPMVRPLARMPQAVGRLVERSVHEREGAGIVSSGSPFD